MAYKVWLASSTYLNQILVRPNPKLLRKELKWHRFNIFYNHFISKRVPHQTHKMFFYVLVDPFFSPLRLSPTSQTQTRDPFHGLGHAHEKITHPKPVFSNSLCKSKATHLDQPSLPNLLASTGKKRVRRPFLEASSAAARVVPSRSPCCALQPPSPRSLPRSLFAPTSTALLPCLSSSRRSRHGPPSATPRRGDASLNRPRCSGSSSPWACLAEPAVPATYPPRRTAPLRPLHVTSTPCRASHGHTSSSPSAGRLASAPPTHSPTSPACSTALDIWVVERDDAYLGSLSPSLQNGYLVCLLYWRVFFSLASPILGLGSSMHELLETILDYNIVATTITKVY